MKQNDRIENTTKRKYQIIQLNDFSGILINDSELTVLKTNNLDFNKTRIIFVYVHLIVKFVSLKNLNVTVERETTQLETINI